jgi:Ni,Fe-hydrogenase I small subunit
MLDLLMHTGLVTMTAYMVFLKYNLDVKLKEFANKKKYLNILWQLADCSICTITWIAAILLPLIWLLPFKVVLIPIELAGILNILMYGYIGRK